MRWSRCVRTATASLMPDIEAQFESPKPICGGETLFHRSAETHDPGKIPG